MTADEIQRLAVRLANQTWCRYWLNFFNRNESVKMAIQSIDADGKPQRIRDFEMDSQFELYSDGSPDCRFIYLVDRTNKDGSPFVSVLF